MIFYFKNPPGWTYLKNFYCQTCLKIPWGGMYCSDSDINNNRYVTADGSWIKFNGDAQCVVTATPNYTLTTPYIEINGTQTNITSTSQTVTIPSSAFTWNGSQYRATVYLNNICMKYSTQSSGYIVYPRLLSTTSSSVTYSYNNYSGSRICTTGSTSSYDSSLKKYYLQLPRNATGKFAVRRTSKTECVNDIIDFSSSTSGKNGVLSCSFSGSYYSGLYKITSSSTSGTLSTTKRGKIEFLVAPSFYSTSNYGTIYKTFGGDTSTKTVYGVTKITINSSEMQRSGSSYYMNFVLGNLTLLNAKLFDEPGVESDIIYPSLSNTRRLDWRSSSVSATNISFSGNHSNWSSNWGYNRLNTSYTNFYTWNNTYCSDITVISDSTAQMCAYIYLPEYYYSDSYTRFLGPVRLFSPMKRNSSRKYMRMYPYSSSYNNIMNLLEHDFTLPYNYVLRQNGYQTTDVTPTKGAENATSALCTKLKNTYGNNLRIYVIKYRAQTYYQPFPIYNGSTRTEAHDYSVINSCASSTATPYLYNISSEADLKKALDAIANNIKDWAGYTKEVVSTQ